MRSPAISRFSEPAMNQHVHRRIDAGDGRWSGNLDLCLPHCGKALPAGSDGALVVYQFEFIQHGHAIYPLPNGSLALGAGQMMVINPDESGEVIDSGDCEKFTVRIPESLFVEACAEHGWQKPQGAIRFKPASYDFGMLGNLLPVLQFLCEELESEMATPQILQHYKCLVASKLLTLLQHNVNLSAPRTQCVPFERLVHYIEANIKRDISAEELAHYAHMSLRSLYLVFEKNANTTPKDFIRQKKLEQVYATLTNPASNLINVTAVALEYGFNHLGRFSEFYKNTFGVLPSESLKTRQAHGLMSRHGHA
jgi:AraC-like DNA-binding protein